MVKDKGFFSGDQDKKSVKAMGTGLTFTKKKKNPD